MTLDKAIELLVVDDEESILSLLSELLTDEGYRVTSCTSAEQALEILKSRSIPLVIADNRLPGMSGIDLLRKVREISGDIQVLIMTSHASLDMAINALRGGATEFLLKPFEDLHVVIAIVKRALDKYDLIQKNRELLIRLKQENEELERVNNKLKALSRQDGMTGLYNHRYMKECLDAELARAIRHGRAFSIAFMDLDHFKHYNDTHGHQRGDELLCGFARLLREGFRETDMVARYGGEEFLVILPETDKNAAISLAGRLRQQISAHPFEGRESQPGGKITVSIGVVSYPSDATTADGLIKVADEALYRAKNAGRNRVC